MPLTLVLGAANSAKAGEVLGAYADAAQRGALLVVPTWADAEHYARELASERAALGTVLTFGGLAQEIARRAGYTGRRLSALQRDRVLQHTVARASLQTLAPSASAPGFAPALGALIAELQRDLVTPQRFAQALRAWAAQDERRAAYAGELAALYSGYVRELDRRGRVDGDLFAWRALDGLRAAPGRWGSDAVFFYGFDDLTGLERDAVETLARVVGAEVTVSLTYEPGRAALAARAPTVEELRPLAERVLELPALDEHYAPGARHALHHAERSLFEPGPRERIDPGDAIRLLEAGGERAEAEILELLGAGVPPGEIVVVYRSPAGVAPLVASVFAEYGVPLAYARQQKLGHTPLGRGLLALARCAWLGERASAGDLIEYLRAPGVLRRRELADGLEADVRREGLRTLAQARERLGFELNEIDELRDAADPLAELSRRARRLFAQPHRAQAPVLSAREERDAAALAALLAACEQLAELGERPAGPELIELLSELEVRSAPPSQESTVLLAEPLAIRARRFRAVFVCGLQEGEFPLPGAPEPFLSDERRFELAASSGLRLAGSEDSLERERYLFYACVSRATERVVLSYRSSDEEGNLALPSPFIADVAELLDDDWPNRRRRRLLADVVWGSATAPTAREAARTAAAEAARSTQTIAQAQPLGLGAGALAQVRHAELLSAGALECYADCPVKWLVERELAPAQLEPEADPLVRGSFVHSLLEELLSRLGGAVTPQNLPDAQRILGELLAERGPLLAPWRPEGVRAGALRAIEADLRRYLAHEARTANGWRPEQLELRFGFEESELPALELGDGVRLRGVIDRLDVDGAGHAVVRDYKSGPAKPEHQGGKWASERQLQVALYMLAARRLLGLEPVAGFYQPLGGNDLRARGVFLEGAALGDCVFAADSREPAELEAVLADAEARAVALARRLRSGELEPCPQTCSREGCRYPGICRAQ